MGRPMCRPALFRTGWRTHGFAPDHSKRIRRTLLHLLTGQVYFNLPTLPVHRANRLRREQHRLVDQLGTGIDDQVAD